MFVYRKQITPTLFNHVIIVTQDLIVPPRVTKKGSCADDGTSLSLPADEMLGMSRISVFYCCSYLIPYIKLFVRLSCVLHILVTCDINTNAILWVGSFSCSYTQHVCI